jgi:hypothetical protein
MKDSHNKEALISMSKLLLIAGLKYFTLSLEKELEERNKLKIG